MSQHQLQPTALIDISNVLLPGEHLTTVITLSLQPIIDSSKILVASPSPVIVHLVAARLHIGT